MNTPGALSFIKSRVYIILLTLLFCSCQHNCRIIDCAYIGWQDKPMYSYTLLSKEQNEKHDTMMFHKTFILDKTELDRCMSITKSLINNDSIEHLCQLNRLPEYGSYCIAIRNKQKIYLNKKDAINYFGKLKDVFQPESKPYQAFQNNLKRLGH